MQKKRRLSKPTDNDDSNRSKQRLEDSFEVDAATSTTDDEEAWRSRLISTISDNKDLIESNGLSKSIVPILNTTDHKGKAPIDNDGYVWLHGSTIAVFGKGSNKIRPAVTKNVNWGSTLSAFFKLVESRGFSVKSYGNNETTRSANSSFESGNDDERHGVLSGINEDMDQNLSNADNDAKRILSRYYEELLASNTQIAYKLHPVIDSKDGVKIHQSYYFTNPSERKFFNIKYNIKNSKGNTVNKAVTGEALSNLMKSIRWMDTFTALMDGLQYMEKFFNGLEVNTGEEASGEKNLYTNLAILDKVLQNVTKSTERTSRVKQQSIEPYVSLKQLHDESEEAFQSYGEALRVYDEVKEKAKHRKGKAMKSALKAATAAMRATKAIYLAKAKAYSIQSKLVNKGDRTDLDGLETSADKKNRRREVSKTMIDMLANLNIGDDGEMSEEQKVKSQFSPLTKPSGRGLKGRGLRGAGARTAESKSVYQTGIKRAGNGRYNLYDIQGTALASAFIYKQIGSKYIRIPELNDNVLYIVRPSREKMGPRIDISKGLTEVIKDLVYNQSISQAAYDKLSVDDQKLFKEVLRIIHIQHAFRDELPDPLASLKMEYDKLKGELMLGNDNPDIRKQLKIVCVDMYSNKLIGDSEFKDIISRLL